MIGKDDFETSLKISANKGSTKVNITGVEINSISDGDSANIEVSIVGGIATVNLTNIVRNSEYTYINFKITTEDGVGYETFTLFDTSFDSETNVLNIGDENLIVPCSNGKDADAKYLEDLQIPINLSIGGTEFTIESIVTSFNEVPFDGVKLNTTEEGQYLTFNSFPEEDTGNIIITAKAGDYTLSESIRYTKITVSSGTTLY